VSTIGHVASVIRSSALHQAEWIPMWVDLYQHRSFNRREPGGRPTWAPSMSSPVTWWSKRRTRDSVMILFGTRSCHVPEEMEPCLLNKRRNLMTTGRLLDSVVMCLTRILRNDNNRILQTQKTGANTAKLLVGLAPVRW